MKVFSVSLWTLKNYNMGIYTSDHIGKWYWLRYGNIILLAEEYSTEISRAVSNKQLIQGDAGVHVMSVNGKTMTSTLSSDVLIEIPNSKNFTDKHVPSVVIPPYNPGYKDVLDLLIYDFDLIRKNLYNPEIWYMSPRNLLTSASIQIGSTVRCSLNYNAYYDQIFDRIQFADVFPSNYDFLARVAKNYDCRFYATQGYDNFSNFSNFTTSYDQLLKVLSGSININVNYSKIYLAGTESEYPIYSPQGYEVSGSITIPARSWNQLRDVFNSKVVTFTNFSLLVGNRYLRLGQTVIEEKMNLSMGDSLMTAEISFKGYGRL